MPPPRPYYSLRDDNDISLHSRPRPYLDPRDSSFHSGRRFSSSYGRAPPRPPPIIIDGRYAGRPRRSWVDDDSEFSSASYERRSKSADEPRYREETRRREREDLDLHLNVREAPSFKPAARSPPRRRAYVEDEFEIREEYREDRSPKYVTGTRRET